MEKRKLNFRNANDLVELSSDINDELGEFLHYFGSLDRYSYCMSDKFREAYKKELDHQIKRINDEFVEVTETISYDVKTKDIRHKSEL